MDATERRLKPLDSTSMGDPTRFLSFDGLVAGLDGLDDPPADAGTLVSVVIRGEGGRRGTPARITFTREAGVEGDAWARAVDPNPDGQIAVMQAGVASLIANGQPVELFGDNLFLDLDLSRSNLPAGSLLRLGTALLEVTPKPHNGCVKFRGRFGDDALRFVSVADLRWRNLRGIYLRVRTDGEANVGDEVTVVDRPAAGSADDDRGRAG